jgi:hypothetical protein
VLDDQHASKKPDEPCRLRDCGDTARIRAAAALARLNVLEDCHLPNHTPGCRMA